MKIIIRLVGYSEIINDEKYVYELEYNVNTIFNFEILKMIFNKYHDIISANELNNCTLTGNSKNLKKDYLINETTKKVFIFTGNTEIKNKLINIFKTNGYKVLVNDISTNNDTNNDINNDTNNDIYNDTNDISTDIDSTNNDMDDIDNDIDKKIFNLLENTEYDNDYDNEYDNENTELINLKKHLDLLKDDTILQHSDVEPDNENNYEDTEPKYIKQNLDLLKDNDFVTLLRIYKTRGTLFNDFYKYINSSQIIKFNKLENTIDYNENLNFIKELNLDFKENDIIEALKKTGNHINLSIRYLLYNN
jgi:hypothetical protein